MITMQNSSLQRIPADNLNPLYVYEAKTALLVRIAQTRQGAERLLDSRIFSLLTHCDFLDARPQNDHAFLGKLSMTSLTRPMLTIPRLDFDSFLPSAIERYHQLLIPALQLAVSVLSAAGHTPVVSKQVWTHFASKNIFELINPG